LSKVIPNCFRWIRWALLRSAIDLKVSQWDAKASHSQYFVSCVFSRSAQITCSYNVKSYWPIVLFTFAVISSCNCFASSDGVRFQHCCFPPFNQCNIRSVKAGLIKEFFYFQVVVFQHMYWVTLAVVYITVQSTISIFNFGFILWCFLFLWHGQALYLQPRTRLFRLWKIFIGYNYFTLLAKVCLQVGEQND